MDNILGTVFGKIIMLIGIAAVAALAYAGMTRSKESSVVSDLSQIATNVDGFYSGQNTGYTAFSTAVLTNSTNGLLPSDLSAAAVSVSAATQTSFSITDALPSGVSCARIFMALGPVNIDSQATSCGTAGSFVATFN